MSKSITAPARPTSAPAAKPILVKATFLGFTLTNSGTVLAQFVTAEGDIVGANAPEGLTLVEDGVYRLIGRTVPGKGDYKPRTFWDIVLSARPAPAPAHDEPAETDDDAR